MKQLILIDIKHCISEGKVGEAIDLILDGSTRCIAICALVTILSTPHYAGEIINRINGEVTWNCFITKCNVLPHNYETTHDDYFTTFKRDLFEEINCHVGGADNNSNMGESNCSNKHCEANTFPYHLVVTGAFNANSGEFKRYSCSYQLE